MDYLEIWNLLKIFFGSIALILAVISIFIIIQLRGIFNWKSSIKKQLTQLKNEAKNASPRKQDAILIVLNKCNQIKRSFFLDIKEISNIPYLIKSIASCYHPQCENPELQITTGTFLQATKEITDHIELILNRKAFKRIKNVRVKHIIKIYNWGRRLTKNPIFKKYLKFRSYIDNFLLLRIIIFFDPIYLIIFILNQVTILNITTCLLMDIYIFVGRLTINCYDEDNEIISSNIELEETLKDLNSLETLLDNEKNNFIDDPDIKAIRNECFGLSAILTSSISFQAWKKAILESLELIAQKHFPDSDKPIEEVALGPLFERGSVWIKSIHDTKDLPIITKLHDIKIEHIYDVKSITETLPPTIKNFIVSSIKIYKQLNWPLTIIRWIKRASPTGIAVELALSLSQKSILYFVSTWTFDTACKEIYIIYGLSSIARSGDKCLSSENN